MWPRDRPHETEHCALSFALLSEEWRCTVRDKWGRQQIYRETTQGKTGKPCTPGPVPHSLVQPLPDFTRETGRRTKQFCARRAVGVQVIYCHLQQRVLLSIKLLTYAPNNNSGLPGGQKQTTKSLRNIISPSVGFTAFTQLQLRGWQGGQVTGTAAGAGLVTARSWVWLCRGTWGTHEMGPSCLSKGRPLLLPTVLSWCTSTAEIPMEAP